MIPELEKAAQFWAARFEKTSDGSFLINRSDACKILGDLADQEGAFEEACQWYANALDAARKLEQQQPQDPQATNRVFAIAYLRALLLAESLHRYADALADLQLAIERAPSQFRQSLREAAISLAGTLVQSGDHAAAVSGVAEIVDFQAAEGQSGKLACDAAGVLAQAAEAALRAGDAEPAEAKRQCQAYLSQGMQYLRMAQKAGFFDTEEGRQWLRTSPDLDPLRQHEEFGKLLEEAIAPPDAEPETPEPPQPRVASHGELPLAAA
jgi:tetratricopeptide (TPR) repeat protein